MTKMMTVTKDSDISLAGISVELVFVDKAIKGLVLTDGKGGHMEVRASDWSFNVLVPAPPEMVDRWQIKGTVSKIPFDELFETEYEATARLGELTCDAEVKPVKVSVPL